MQTQEKSAAAERPAEGMAFVRALHELVDERRTVFIITGVMAILGIMSALDTPREFRSQVVLAPELTNTNRMSESLGSLTAMLGVDLNSLSNNNVDAIFPELYPRVVGSEDFIVELWTCPVTLQDGTTKSYFDHICNDEDVPLLSRPGKWLHDLLGGDGPEDHFGVGDSVPDSRFFDKHLEHVCDRMSRNIGCDVSKDNGLITISVTDNDPYVACTMADTIQRKLQQYITDYRTQKARNDYNYALKLCNEARQEYLDAQLAAANFADANISVFKQKVIIERDILQNEFQIKYNTYNALSSQLQNAKALIQAATPVYTVINNSKVPNEPSSQSRGGLVILYILVGLVLSAVWILFARDYLHQLVAQYRQLDQ